MRNPAYLSKAETGIFYFRWPIPRQLHPKQSATTLKLSLGTRDPRNALRLARFLIQMGEEWNEHGLISGMRYEELRGTLTRHFKELLEKKKAEIANVGRLTEEDRKRHISRMQETQKAIAENAPIPTSKSEGEMLSAFIKKYDLAIEDGSTHYEWLQRDIKHSFRSYIQAVLDYDLSLEHFDLEQSQPPADGAALETPPVRNTGRPTTIEELAKRFLTERNLGNNWVARTKLEKRDHIELLQEILGAATDVQRLSANDATGVKDTLLKLPKNRNKKALTRGKPLAEVLAMTNVERLQAPSINKYLQTYSDLFEYACQNNLMERNWFAGLAIKQNRQRRVNDRKAFSASQVKLLIAGLTEEPSLLVRKPYQKWGPLIGLYTGARLNEIAQIDLADIRQKGDIWLFDLNDEGKDKHLKTKAARRLVPIHSKLIEYGLLEYADSLRKTGKKKLFPDLPNTVEHGRGRNIGRWFNERFLPQLGIKDRGLVYHSLRHTFITRLSQADVQEAVVKTLVGHARQGVTQQSYFKEGYTLEQLNHAVQTLDYSSLKGRA